MFHYSINNALGFFQTLIQPEFQRVRAEDYLRGAIEQVNDNIELLKGLREELTEMFEQLTDPIKQVKDAIKEQKFEDSNERLKLLELFIDNFKTHMQRDSLTQRQRVILLRQLGVLESILYHCDGNVSRLAKLLSVLTDTSEQNLRELLAYITPYTISYKDGRYKDLEKDLIAVKRFLEKLKMPELAKQVELEIDKLQKRL